ncbi:MAG: hypothetical protein N2109_04765 [Fimbriimonadales bacterium]|nr:hypothetical protein [Fimbriimonadales bacterium]
MDRLRFSVEGLLSGPENMRRDRELLSRAEAGERCCRVYGWDGAWVSLGYWQRPERDLLPACPVPWVMRPTGGKAVLHGHDVTVGLAWPLADLAEPGEDPVVLSRALKRVYRRVIAPLVSALRACGVPASLAERTPFVAQAGRTADCFAHIAPNDVVDERTGLKVCGCALRLTQRAVLAQASVPNGPPLVDPAAVFERPAAYSQTRWEATGFAEALRWELERL